MSLQAAATIPNNFCTAFYTLSEKLGIDLQWPCPEDVSSGQKHQPILIWGGSGSVGQYALQILAHWGYTNVIATASLKHHEMVNSFGATHVVDYRDPAAVGKIRALVDSSKSTAHLRVFDCIDSKQFSMRPVSEIATQSNTIVAALLPVVISRPSASDPNAKVQIATRVADEADWAPGVQVIGVATYFYESVSQFLSSKSIFDS